MKVNIFCPRIVGWVSAVIIVLTLLTIVLRVGQVALEPCPWQEVNVKETHWTRVDVLGYGVMRRVDDDKFWVFLMVGVSGFWVGKGLSRIEADDRRMRPWAVAALTVVVTLIVVGEMWEYRSAANRRGGTWYWTAKEDHKVCNDIKVTPSPRIWWLQATEFVIYIISIAAHGFFALAMMRTPCVEDKNRAAYVTRQHLRACMAVPIGGALFYTAFTIFVSVLESSRPTTASQGTGSASEPVHALGVITAISFIYVVAFVLLLVRFRSTVALVLSKKSWWGFVTIVSRP